MYVCARFTSAAASSPFIPFSTGGSRKETRVELSKMRKMIAKNMKLAQNTNAQLTTFQETDMGELIQLRKNHKDEFEKVSKDPNPNPNP
jgi:2-oxoglutarate dehydrogenase E2 component (dihydrolipoamide succinyltransferase)